MKETKRKQTNPHDLIIPMLAVLLAIIVLLLITPSVCGCRVRTSSAPANNQAGGSTTNTTTSTTPITSSSTASSTSSAQPSSFFLSPITGPVGTTVTINGSGFTADNTIEMNGLTGGAMKDIASPNEKMLTFTIPTNLGPNCKPTEPCPQFLELVMPKTYTVSVVTNGVTQDIGAFTVTGN